MIPKHTTPRVVVILVTAALVCAGVAALNHAKAKHREAAGATLRPEGVEVEFAVATQQYVAPEVSASGFLRPFEELTISAQVAGYIASQLVDVSDRVRVGDSLFQLDTSLRESAVHKARAAVDRAGTDLQFANKNRDRLLKLQTQQSANATEILQADTEVAVAAAVLKQAEAGLEDATILLDKTVIRSPLTGFVSKLHRRKGEYAHIGRPLIEIIETDRLKLLVELNDGEIVPFAPGDPVSVRVTALPGEPLAGSILRIHPGATADTRKFVVEIEIPNPGHRLRPGFYAEARLMHGETDEADAHRHLILTIPRMAIVDQRQKQYCYVVRHVESENQERAFRVPIETVPILSDPHHVAVLSGIVPGDRVITTGLRHVRHNGIVRIAE